MHINWVVLAAICSVAAVVGKFAWAAIKAGYRFYRDVQVSQRFAFDVATNHLPHVYEALKKIAAGVGAEIVDPPPPIRFVSFDEDDAK